MNIAVLVYGQYRAAEELLEENILQLKQALHSQGDNPKFDVYILSDKLESGNYSDKMELFVKGCFQKHQLTVNMIEYWEDFQDCKAYEEILSSHLNRISSASLGVREQWATSLWYRRYILWKRFEALTTAKNITYDYVLFTRIFDTRIKSLKPVQIHSAKDTLLFSIDTFFLGSPKIMKQLFQFGSSTENWKNFEWTTEFTNGLAKFDSCLAETKPTFSSEAQVFQYIFKNITNYKNIRYDFNSPSNSPTNQEAYMHIKIERVNIIPKRILQIAIGDAYVKGLPLEQIKQNILQNHNTEYDYTLLTDLGCQAFLKESFPQFYNLYNTLQRPQYKSDLVRYLYLYKNGGYYIDIDLLPLIPLYTIFEYTKNSSTFFTIGAHTSSKKNTFELCNGFIGTKAGNPLFLDLVELMQKDPNPEDYGANVKRLYKKIAVNHSMTPFKSENSVYLFREVQHAGKYYIVNNKEIIAHSNGHNYPPPPGNGLKI